LEIERIGYWLMKTTIFLFCFMIFVSSVLAQDSPVAFPDAVCLNTFEAFSYGDREKARPGPFAYPTPAWTLYTSVPLDLIPNLTMLENIKYSISATVVASRRYNGQHELWVAGAVTASNFRHSFLSIYKPALNEWEFISEANRDPNLLYQWFFVTPDGSVWVSHQWSDRALPAMTSVPILSRFNEVTRQFELVQTAPQVQVMDRSEVYGVNLRTEIVLDTMGIFWIFNIDSSLYRYDPVSGMSERRLDLTTVVPRGVYSAAFSRGAAVAPDGTIYFAEYPLGAFGLSDRAVFQYHPQTNDITPVQLPQDHWPDYVERYEDLLTGNFLINALFKRWPSYGGLYVDSRNWLWLATVGYRDDAGEWHLLHTAVDEQFDDPLRHPGAMPITTETSDGRLWTVQFERGTGWLNPMTGTGCKILSNWRDVFEDIEGYVWIGYGTQGALYRYDATP
jgi:hypothetical protein